MAIIKANDPVLDLTTPPISGVIMSSSGAGINMSFARLFGVPTPIVGDDAVPLNYLTNNTLDSAGDIMTAGFLTLFQNPVNPLHAVTKQYADAIAASLAAGVNRQSYVALTGQTVFPFTHSPGFTDVFLNGVKLVDGIDFVANGSTITLTTPAALNDNLDLISLVPATAIPLARKNAIINGNFDIWQRETSFTILGPTLAAFYTADRWTAGSDSATFNATITRQTFTVGQTDVPNEPTFYLQFSVTANSGPGGFAPGIGHRIEDVRTFAGKTITVSFWAKSPIPFVTVFACEQRFGAGGSPGVTFGLTPFIITTAWQQFIFTVNVPSIATKILGTGHNLAISIGHATGSTTTGIIDLAQVQVEEGLNATQFERRHIAEEIALCQRYYTKTYNLSVNPGTPSGPGAIVTIAVGTGPQQATIDWRFPQRMRVAPVIVIYSPTSGASGVFNRTDPNTDIPASASAMGEDGVWIQNPGATLAMFGHHAHATADAEFS